MATLARLYDFTAGTPIVSGQVDGEFNQIINALNSTSTNVNLIVRFSSGTVAPLKLDQLGAGPVQTWAVSGVDKATVTNAGSFSTAAQFISSLAIGTKPIDVTSTTVCTNLNADLLDGLHSSSFLRLDSALDQTMIGNLVLSLAAPQLYFIDTDNSKQMRIALDNTVWNFNNDTAGGTPISIATATNVVTFAAIPVLPASTPSSDNQAARKKYVDDQDTATLARAVLNDTAGQSVTSNFNISGTAPVLTFTNTTGSAQDFSFTLDANVLTAQFVGGSNLIEFDYNSGSPELHLLSGLSRVEIDAACVVAGVPRCLVVDTTTTTNSGTGETDFTSYTIPANTLKANGDFLRFNLAGVSNNSTLRVYLNSTAIFSLLTESGTALDWRVEALVIRRSNTTVDAYVTYWREHRNYDDSARAAVHVVRNLTVAVNSLSGSTNTFKATGQNAGGSPDISQNLLIGEVVNM
jgi:hypothetical protein